VTAVRRCLLRIDDHVVKDLHELAFVGVYRPQVGIDVGVPADVGS
jgi:hypothetical protein